MNRYFASSVPSAAPGARLASPGRRLGAWLIDAVIAGFVLSPIVSIFEPARPAPATHLLPEILPSVLLVLLYLVLFDGGPRGATPGKRLLHMRVVDAQNGGSIGYNRATIRRVGYLIGGLCLYIGWLWLLVDARRQAWHDKLAHTVVVRTD